MRSHGRLSRHLLGARKWTEHQGNRHPDFLPNPYEDYGRFLTPEGGILIIYKDLDFHSHHAVWRLFAWAAFMGLESTYLFYIKPLQSQWITIVCFILVALINWSIVDTIVQTYRSIEIRPDCLIIGGTNVFWARFMENGMPTFRPDAVGNQVLCGTYGTRFVEFLITRRFDENDRMPEVIAAHITDAMRQLWAKPYH